MSEPLLVNAVLPELVAASARRRASPCAGKTTAASLSYVSLVPCASGTHAAARNGSVSQGLDITWAVSVDEKGTGQVTLRWQERGGPPVSPPTRKGFVSMVTRTSIERQLKGRIDYDWQAGGLKCTLSLPAGEVVGAPPMPQADDRPQPVGAVLPSLASLDGRHILVIEDEVDLRDRKEGNLYLYRSLMMGAPDHFTTVSTDGVRGLLTSKWASRLYLYNVSAMQRGLAELCASYPSSPRSRRGRNDCRTDRDRSGDRQDRLVGAG